MFRCFDKTTSQMISLSKVCDGKTDCFDLNDEVDCSHCTNYINEDLKMKPYVYADGKSICFLDNSKCPKNTLWEDSMSLPSWITSKQGQHFTLEDLKPWVAHLDGCGGSYLTPLTTNDSCPETHVRCPDAYCIPSYTLNNGVYDCPHHQTDDEFFRRNGDSMEEFSCEGHYRCYENYICVHEEYMCDGIHHCPLKDDERFCDIKDHCPKACLCEGFALTCFEVINPKDAIDTRYLDVHGIDLSSNSEFFEKLHWMYYIQFLNFSSCSLRDISLYNIQSLKVLDVSNNYLKNLSAIDVDEVKHLLYFSISGNPGILNSIGSLQPFLCSTGIYIERLFLADIGLFYRLFYPFTVQVG